MSPRPVVLTDDERAVLESLAHDWMLGHVLTDPAGGLHAIRTSGRGGGDPFTSVDWTEDRAIVRRWYEPTPEGFYDQCYVEARGETLSAYHRDRLHVDGRCVTRWDIGEPVRTARITWRRLEAWAAGLPADIRERARTEWREPATLIRDALGPACAEPLTHYAGQIPGQEALF